MAESKLPTDPKYDQYDFPTTAPDAVSGHPGHTTPEQDAKVHQLRTMLEQEGYTERLDTLTLLRFLRARKFDVELAKQMYVPLLWPWPSPPISSITMQYPLQKKAGLPATEVFVAV